MTIQWHHSVYTNPLTFSGYYLVEDAETGEVSSYTPEALYDAWDITLPFDPDQVRSDVLFALFASELSDGDDINTLIADTLIAQTALLLYNHAETQGEHLQGLDDLRAIEDSLRALLGEGHTVEDVANLANDIASMFSDPESANLAQFTGAQEILRLSGLYLIALQVDEIRKLLYDWNSEAETKLLEQLRAAFTQIPDTILSVSVIDVRVGFEAFYGFMMERHNWLSQMQIETKGYEDQFGAMREAVENEQATLDNLAQLAGEAILSLYKPIDWLLSARDLLGGEALGAIAGLLLPVSLERLKRIGRSGLNVGQAILDNPQGIWRLLRKTPISTFDTIQDLFRIDLANTTLRQAIDTAVLVRQYGFEIHITGRLADTAAEAATRRSATIRALELAQSNPLLAGRLDPSLINNPVAMNEIIKKWRPEDPEYAAWANIQLQVSNEFHEQGIRIGPAQVKVSTGDPEVDVFIPEKLWNDLPNESSDRNVLTKKTFRERLMEIYNVPKVDICTAVVFLERIRLEIREDSELWLALPSQTPPESCNRVPDECAPSCKPLPASA